MKIEQLANPFERIAGFKALIIGLLGVFAAGTIGYYSKTHFDGILNIHSGLQGSLFLHLSEPIISILTISLWFLTGSWILSPSKIRAIDVIGTQFFAFLPLVPASLIGFSGSMERFNQQMMDYIQHPTQPISLSTGDSVVTGFLILIILVLTIWSGTLIFYACKISANLSNKKLIPLFISGIIIGMAIPKLIFHFIS